MLRIDIYFGVVLNVMIFLCNKKIIGTENAGFYFQDCIEDYMPVK